MQVEKNERTGAGSGASKAREFLQWILCRAGTGSDGDELLDMALDDPLAATRRLGSAVDVQLTREEALELRSLARGELPRSRRGSSGRDAVQALVDCREREDMPEVVR